MTPMLRYGSLTIDPPLVLAPMAGITDRQFRLVLRRLGGVGLVTMEFISSEGLTRENKRTLGIFSFSEEEHPISIQIYGSNAARMADAARRVQDLGADICDINMGCPANKILKGCAGCRLMGDPDNVRRILSAVRSAISIPLATKFRLGMNDQDMNFVEIGRICEGEGVDLVAMHARTAKQMYRGEADWNHIAELKDALTIPVVGNGDVKTAEDALRMFRETGCDGVMIGRMSMKNPWIYRQTVDLMAGRPAYTPTAEDRRALILDHFHLLLDQLPVKLVLHKLRTFTGWYTRGLYGGKRLRVLISSLETPEAFIDAVDEFFDAEQQAITEVV
jgi:tRNA-dihydrouridine synthase B